MELKGRVVKVEEVKKNKKVLPKKENSTKPKTNKIFLEDLPLEENKK